MCYGGCVQTWYTADLHLGHHRIIELTGRPWPDAATMNAALVARWNDLVAPDDVVYILGDAFMGQLADTLRLVDQLAGEIHLVPGNHDWPSPAYPARDARKRAERVGWYRDAGIVIEPPIIRGHELPGGRPVDLAHFPYDPDPWHEDRYAAHKPADEGRWLLHGHIHNVWARRGRQVNVGVDVRGYAPVSASSLAALLDRWDPPNPSPSPEAP